MRILRAADHKRMPWKNGGGETVEIAVFPADAALGDFTWRVSMASVATDGPFSIFPEIDRTLSVLSGAGMELTIEGQGEVVLDRSSPPHAFPADVPTKARLIDGPITDLNVMTRRGRYAHTVRRVEAPLTLQPSSALRLLLCAEGGLNVGQGEVSLALGPLDCLVIEPEMQASVRVSGEGAAFLIELRGL
ncbi:HutD family protein [Chelatococcus sp. GCM10030263]|uniref:HutD/Ves family protein n=1 Tax=Chelatococcus sp. GCM10030263 TaxID=3273387 RepID=UPI003608C0C9